MPQGIVCLKEFDCTLVQPQTKHNFLVIFISSNHGKLYNNKKSTVVAIGRPITTKQHGDASVIRRVSDKKSVILVSTHTLEEGLLQFSFFILASDTSSICHSIGDISNLESRKW